MSYFAWPPTPVSTLASSHRHISPDQWLAPLDYVILVRSLSEHKANTTDLHPKVGPTCFDFIYLLFWTVLWTPFFSGGSPMLQLWREWYILRDGHLWWCYNPHRPEHQDMFRELLHAGHWYNWEQRRSFTANELSCRYCLGVGRHWIVCWWMVWEQRRGMSLSARHPILSHWCNTRYRTLLLLWQPVSLYV